MLYLGNGLYSDRYLCHHGIKGQRWGVRNGPPYPLEDRVFISGSSKTQLQDSPFYRKDLPKQVTNKIDSYISGGKRILVGDAPGIDTQVQKYLANKEYKKVVIYTTEDEPRANADYFGKLGWKVNKISSKKKELQDRLVDKDIAMSKDATEGFAITIENGSRATRNNIDRMNSQGKEVDVFQLNSDGKDDWDISVSNKINKSNKDKINEIFETMSLKDKKRLWVGYDNKKHLPFFGDNEYDNGTGMPYSIVYSKNGKPISFLVVGVDNGVGEIGLGVRNDKKYRGKGNASSMTKKMIDWFNSPSNTRVKSLEWYAYKSNPGSYKAALANGFEKYYEGYDKSDGGKEEWVYLRYPPQNKEVKHA